MKKILLAALLALLALLPSAAFGQCSGQFTANQVCGSIGGGLPTAIASTSVPAGVLTVGTTGVSGASGGQVLYGNGGILGSTAALTLGASGTPGSLTLGNATSGLVTLQPVTGALGTVTASLPANSGTIAELNLAQAWTAVQTVSITPAANTSVGGFNLLDPTAASAGNQQFSPRLRLSGQGWTTATAASQQVDFILENQTVQGTSAPSGNLVISAQVNSGGYTALYTLGSDGGLTLGAPTGGDKGAGTINVAGGLYVNNVLISVTTVPLTLYVNSSSGNDSNSCISAGLACQHIQSALNKIIATASVYSGTSPTINIADGTYTEQVTCGQALLGGATINIVGDLATPTNVQWTPPNGLSGLIVNNGCNVTLSGVYFTSSGTPCVYLDTFGGTINFQTVNFGTLNASAGCGEDILIDQGGVVRILGNFTISGNMSYFVLLVGPSFLQHVEASFSMPNVLTFTDFYEVSGPGNVNYDQTVTCSGSGCGAGSTGGKFLVVGNGNIATNSSTIPGATAGSLSSGGCVDSACGYGQVLSTTPDTFASLATCNSVSAGSLASVTDSTTVTWGATITGGGSNDVLAYCNGAHWTVAGL